MKRRKKKKEFWTARRRTGTPLTLNWKSVSVIIPRSRDPIPFISSSTQPLFLRHFPYIPVAWRQCRFHYRQRNNTAFIKEFEMFETAFLQTLAFKFFLACGNASLQLAHDCAPCVTAAHAILVIKSRRRRRRCGRLRNLKVYLRRILAALLSADLQSRFAASNPLPLCKRN